MKPRIMRRFSIRIRLGVMIILLGAFFGTVAAVVNFWYLNNILIDEKIKNLKNTALEQAHESTAIIKKYELFAKMLSESKQVAEYLEEPTEERRKEWDMVFTDYAHSDADILSVYLMDIDGLTLISTDQTFVGQNYGFREYFKSALGGNRYIGVAWGRTSNQFGIYFSYPVYSSAKKIVGVLVVKVSQKMIVQPILDSGFNSTLMIVDDLGVVIASTVPEIFLHSLGPLSDEALDRIARENRFLGREILPLHYTEIQNAVSEYSGPQVIDLVNEARKERELFGTYKLSDLPFFLVFDIKLGDIRKLTLFTVASLSLVILILVVLAAFITYILVDKFLTGPLETIETAARKISEGDFSYRIPNVYSNDEMGDLAYRINQMAEKLGGYYHDLDDQVKNKTIEIENKNKNLDKQQKVLVNILEDVAAEKEALAAAKAQDEAILNGIGDGVFVLDAKKRIILFNPVAEMISGYTAAEVLGQKYDKFLKFVLEKDEKPNDGFIEDALSGGKAVLMFNHTALIRKDGDRVPVADSAAPIKDDEGNTFGCVVVFRDITKEREIDRMKTEFVSVASHQLRTPLTGIKWFSEILLKSRLSVDLKDHIKQIAVSNERMIRLVDDLLSVSRIETGRKFDVVLKNVDLVTLVKSVIEEQSPSAQTKNISMYYSKDAPQKLILAVDEIKIRQVFQNLISNSIKYSKEGSQITVGCDHSGKDDVKFFVKDNGVGIPRHQQSSVFSKFFRADNVLTMHTDGTGLGLYIVKAIVEAHGGKIWFESVEGKGTTFFFTLPIKLI